MKKKTVENPAACARQNAARQIATGQNATVQVDARIPMGMLFTLTGTILTAFGLATRDNAAVYVKSLGIDVNLWWGLALLVFGVVVLLGRAGRRGRKSRIDESAEKLARLFPIPYSLCLLSLLRHAEAHGSVVEGIALELVEGVDAEDAVYVVERGGAKGLS